MEIRLLKKGYKKSEQFYQDFLEDKINSNEEYFEDKVISIPDAPDFPIYMGRGSEEEKKILFQHAFEVISKYYIHIDRDIHLEEIFWHSLLITKKRTYILDNYPDILSSKDEFDKIVVRNFDWVNYIYKVVIASEYIGDLVDTEEEKNRYFELILENQDVYNYIIKYSIFRNAEFVIKFLTIIDELQISKLMKAKIKDPSVLGSGSRYGRRVIFELNKKYPIVMSPLLEIEELKEEIIQALSLYTDVTEIRERMLETV